MLKLEGKVRLYYYQLPASRSTLEVLRNYEGSLKSKGFEVLFSCGTSNGSCYQPRPGWPKTRAPYDFAMALDNPEWPRLGKHNDFARNYLGVSGRYVLVRRTSENATVHASITLAEHLTDVGNHAFVRVV